MSISKLKTFILFIYTLPFSIAICQSEKNIENLIPHIRNIEWNTNSQFADSIINIWSNKSIKEGKEGAKVNNPRVILAKLHAGHIKEANEMLMKQKVWGVSGSAWAFNKLGDYDFTLTALTSILYQFGDKPEILYKPTVDYLLNVLLTEEGNHFNKKTPKTLGFIPETENHILMTEGSRYLKNRWLALHGSQNPIHDNLSNGMESKLLKLLQEHNAHGLYEFNSMPYIGYTITALLNLEAYASDSIRKEARNLLDYMNYCYALASIDYQYFPPMRRRYSRANWQELTTAYHSVFMKAWMSFLPNEKLNFDIGKGSAHAIMGACMPYRPADEIVKLLSEKDKAYFAYLGHGKNASPEIYSAGKNYLLSAGGVNRGEISQLIARPICLFTRNNAKKLEEIFHLYGPGKNFMKWNNTGVYQNFACAAGPVSIPQNQKVISQSKNWMLYELEKQVYLAVYSSETLGIMLVLENQDPDTIIERIEQANPDIKKLKTQFQIPEKALISYNVKAAKSKYVIKKIDIEKIDRNFDKWPLINVKFLK